MEEWIDKEVHAVIECGFDKITGKSRPIIAIGDKKLTWEELHAPETDHDQKLLIP